MATSAERLKQYEDIYSKVKQAQDVPAFQQQFEDDYLKATDYNKDLIQQKSSALGRLQAVAPEMRERYMTGPIMSPTQQRNLIAQARQNPISDWGSAIDLLSQRGMKLQDVLGKAVSGYQSQLAAQNRDLENAWRLYQDQLAQEEAARARAAAAASRGPSLSEILASLGGGAGGSTGGGEVYEIPEETYGSASLGNSYEDRLTKRVLDQRQAESAGDVLKSYAQTSLEPWRNMKSIGDVASLIPRGVSAVTTVYSDLFNRLFKR